MTVRRANADLRGMQNIAAHGDVSLSGRIRNLHDADEEEIRIRRTHPVASHWVQYMLPDLYSPESYVLPSGQISTCVVSFDVPLPSSLVGTVSASRSSA